MLVYQLEMQVKMPSRSLRHSASMTASTHCLPAGLGRTASRASGLLVSIEEGFRVGRWPMALLPTEYQPSARFLH